MVLLPQSQSIYLETYVMMRSPKTPLNRFYFPPDFRASIPNRTPYRLLGAIARSSRVNPINPLPNSDFEPARF